MERLISPSPPSASASAPRPERQTWRLKKTLSRPVDFRPIEDADIRWIFVAYKRNALAGMGGVFANTNMDAATFKPAFERSVIEHYDGAWTLFANTSKGYIPVGVVFGAWAPLAAYMVVAGVVFFPWASRRNIVEATVNFFAGIRRKMPMTGYASDEHKALYEVCCRHGVMRRVGTTLIPGRPTAVFETRA